MHTVRVHVAGIEGGVEALVLTKQTKTGGLVVWGDRAVFANSATQ